MINSDINEKEINNKISNDINNIKEIEMESTNSSNVTDDSIKIE